MLIYCKDANKSGADATSEYIHKKTHTHTIYPTAMATRNMCLALLTCSRVLWRSIQLFCGERCCCCCCCCDGERSRERIIIGAVMIARKRCLYSAGLMMYASLQVNYHTAPIAIIKRSAARARLNDGRERSNHEPRRARAQYYKTWHHS